MHVTNQLFPADQNPVKCRSKFVAKAHFNRILMCAWNQSENFLSRMKMVNPPYKGNAQVLCVTNDEQLPKPHTHTNTLIYLMK